MSFLSCWISCCWGVGSWLCAIAAPDIKPANAIPRVTRRNTPVVLMFSSLIFCFSPKPVSTNCRVKPARQGEVSRKVGKTHHFLYLFCNQRFTDRIKHGIHEAGGVFRGEFLG